MDELRQPNRTVETSRVQSPGRGWKDVWLRIFYGISENRIFLIAAGLTFYAIVALFSGDAAKRHRAQPSLCHQPGDRLMVFQFRHDRAVRRIERGL